MVPRALQALVEASSLTGNASSLHSSGRRARRLVEEARERLAHSVGATPQQVVFTSGGTEADNLAIKGLYWAAREADPARNRILLSSVEHHAVLDPALWLAEHDGAELVWLPVDPTGVLDLDATRRLIADDPARVALVSVMWANNEVGAVQPVDQVVELAHEYRLPVHCDAVQALGSLRVDFAAGALDALTLTGHKLGGPVGAGALLMRREIACVPLLHGGGQEEGRRSGTLAVAGAHALSVATEQAVAQQPTEAVRLAALRDRLVRGVIDAVPDAVLHGPSVIAGVDRGDRLPGNAHFVFAGCEGDSLLYLLDARGIECSTGSACQAGVPQPSHVLLAMGVSAEDARGALRFSLGHTSTEADVDALVSVIGEVVERARTAGLASAGLRSR
jgi:cysteine desulfurase